MAVRFYLNRRNRQDRSPCGVILCAFRGKSRVRVLTDITVKPGEWASKEQRVRKGTAGATEVNRALSEIKADAERLLVRYPDNEDFRQAIRERLGKAPRERLPGILELYEDFLSHKKARVAESTAQTYDALHDHLKAYIGETDAPVSTITGGWLDDFANYLVGEGLQNSTTNKLVSRCKGFLRWAVERGHLERVPAVKPLPTAGNFALYLTAPELATVASIDLTEHPDGYRAARDLFVFAAVTGQRYADLQSMRWDDLREDDSGRFAVWELHVSKLNSALPVPLAAPAVAILERRRGQRRPLPSLSNQKANDYIKEVCKLAKLTEPVTTHHMKGGKRISETVPKHEAVSTHVARKTFITLALQSGLGMNELLGFTHTDLKQLRVYAGQDHRRLTAALHSTFDQLQPGAA